MGQDYSKYRILEPEFTQFVKIEHSLVFVNIYYTLAHHMTQHTILFNITHRNETGEPVQNIRRDVIRGGGGGGWRSCRDGNLKR